MVGYAAFENSGEFLEFIASWPGLFGVCLTLLGAFVAVYQDRSPKTIKSARERALQEAADLIAEKEGRAETRVIAACASLWSIEIRALKEQQ